MQPSFSPATARGVHRHQTLIKLFTLGGLGLLLLVPLGLLSPIVAERSSLRDQAVSEIHRDWGQAQTVVGPVLIVPVGASVSYVFPDELTVSGKVDPEIRSRGIYDTVVFTSELRISGTFRRPTDAELGANGAVAWDQAVLAVGVTDLRGTSTEVALTWAGATRHLLPGSRLERFASGLHAPVDVPEAGPMQFAVALPLRGSQSLQFAPLGMRNGVTLESSWHSPSFFGAYLPMQRALSDRGFTAAWEASYYGRGFGQTSIGALPDIESSLFGVTLLPGIDSYRRVERAVRYGVLFVALSLTSFFLFEVLTKTQVHPLQYALIGLALSVFFLLLLSLSELTSFATSYAVAAACTVGLVVSYVAPVLRTGVRALVAGGLLGISFGVLYVVLSAEHYALAAGSAVVFAALGITMTLTRKHNWYAEGPPAGDAAPPSSVADSVADAGGVRGGG